MRSLLISPPTRSWPGIVVPPLRLLYELRHDSVSVLRRLLPKMPKKLNLLPGFRVFEKSARTVMLDCRWLTDPLPPVALRKSSRSDDEYSAATAVWIPDLVDPLSENSG